MNDVTRTSKEKVDLERLRMAAEFLDVMGWKAYAAEVQAAVSCITSTHEPCARLGWNDLKGCCQDLWKSDVTLVCTLPRGHDGNHAMVGTGCTWTGGESNSKRVAELLRPSQPSQPPGTAPRFKVGDRVLPSFATEAKGNIRVRAVEITYRISVDGCQMEAPYAEHELIAYESAALTKCEGQS